MRRIMLFLVLLISLMFLSNAHILNGENVAEPPGFLFHFFGTLCLLALLDVNARKLLTFGRYLLQLFSHGPHAPHHQAH